MPEFIMPDYINRRQLSKIPPLPLEGELDLTYRCNNDCRHCWLRIPPSAGIKKEELTFEQIARIVEDARQMGCREWSISGGEPMLRPDFADIFDYITRRAAAYSLNTNATLITPQIAELMRRKGDKMVAIYGATKDVYEHITRKKGSFDSFLQGIAYLKEAGAGFTVQIIPLADNYHQYDKMVSLAYELSPLVRVGASYLYLSADGDTVKNEEIKRQRLKPDQIVKLSPPAMNDEGVPEGDRYRPSGQFLNDDRLYCHCIESKTDFHIDPYGDISFCCFVKDPDLRYDLKAGSFKEAWEQFFPSIKDKIKGGAEFRENCGNCKLWADCKWCGVYAYLEHRRHTAKVEYFCGMANESKKYRQNYLSNNRRYYNIAGITVQVDSELPFSENTYSGKFEAFRTDIPGDDLVRMRYKFSIPDFDDEDLGEMVYSKAPLAIYRKDDTWIYKNIVDVDKAMEYYHLYVFNQDHSKAVIYCKSDKYFRKGELESLSMFASDQIPLARILMERDGCYIHSAGAVLEGKGLLFVGHSTAGKSTILKLLKDHVEILCDDRNIIRKWDDGFRLHGSWSHGELPEVSPSSAPLKALFILEKAKENAILPVENRVDAVNKLLACMVKPLITNDWWEKMIDLIDALTSEVPCYILRFDKSGEIVKLIREL